MLCALQINIIIIFIIIFCMCFIAGVKEVNINFMDIKDKTIGKCTLKFLPQMAQELKARKNKM